MTVAAASVAPAKASIQLHPGFRLHHKVCMRGTGVERVTGLNGDGDSPHSIPYLSLCEPK